MIITPLEKTGNHWKDWVKYKTSFKATNSALSKAKLTKYDKS